jgi:uncharacterized alkaline shock family protein YloU
VAKEVLTEIGRINAATECYGIVGMAGTRIKDGIAELLGRENLSRGVEVAVHGDQAEISLYIVVGYGTKISEIAKNVTDKVRYVVESATGLHVTGVHIHVQGVKIGHVN